MVKAFVFGKFLPFHRGHQAMIEFALTRCDFLTVLVCCSDHENIPPAIRRSWIEDTFQGNNRLAVETFCYKESEFPNTSESSRDVSAVWSRKFMELVPDCSLLITSEPYGAYVADFMGIRHEVFDIDRSTIPISATDIWSNPSRYWEYIPKAVKPYFLRKIVLLGTESTGKTTLTQKLAGHYGAPYVLEAARDIIENSNAFCLEDLYTVAREHAKRIKDCPIGHSPLLFIDTDVHITQSYASFMFGKQLDLSQDVVTQAKHTLYLYLCNDVPHVQDGTRLSEEKRNLLDRSHRQTLLRYGIAYHEIKGNWQERFDQAVACIEQATRAVQMHWNK